MSWVEGEGKKMKEKIKGNKINKETQVEKELGKVRKWSGKNICSWAQTGQEARGRGLGLNMLRFTLLAHTSSREATTPRSRGFLKRKLSNTANVPKEHTTTLYTLCQPQFLLPNSHWAIDKWPTLPPTISHLQTLWNPSGDPQTRGAVHASVEGGELNSAQPEALASEQ